MINIHAPTEEKSNEEKDKYCENLNVCMTVYLGMMWELLLEMQTQKLGIFGSTPGTLLLFLFVK